MLNPTRGGKTAVLLILLLRVSVSRRWKTCLCDPKDGCSLQGQAACGSDGDAGKSLGASVKPPGAACHRSGVQVGVAVLTQPISSPHLRSLATRRRCWGRSRQL
jgi:hypothetical protein